jgi:sarcosine oxidase subunit alpha
MSGYRLDSGGQVDRSRQLAFRWDARSLSGFAGDTLASALLANGVSVVGRGFKYHRPRGVTSAGVEESGAIVTLNSGHWAEPNTKATAIELYAGLEAFGQNAWPSVRFDVGELNNLLGRFFSAGFYYKTFMGPLRGTRAWMVYEHVIRRAAGMGTASRAADPDDYETAHAFCDVLVVGSGPAGLEAALTVAESGLDVMLVEQDFELGGDSLTGLGQIGEQPAADWRRSRVDALNAHPRVRLLTRTTAFGLYDGCVAGLVERVTDHLPGAPSHLPRQRFWTVRPKRVIVASGALERTIAFGDNDRPGVMSAAAAATYVGRFGVAPGRRAVVATNNDSGYRSAAALARAGVETTLLDVRSSGSPETDELLTDLGIEVRCGVAPLQALGRSPVSAVRLARAQGGDWRADDQIACDLLAVSGGWSPVVNLLSHRGVRPIYDPTLAAFLPGEYPEPIHVCGSAAGVWRPDDCARSGQSAGGAAAEALGKGAALTAMPPPGGWHTPIHPVWEVNAAGGKGKCFVDPQHDVTTEDVRQAHREGFVSVEHLKRYTTLGMATDQGKVGNVIGLALMAEASGSSIAETGTTTFRPPYTPVALGALSGRSSGSHWRPTRMTPMHRWHLARGARMTEAGLWLRPWYYPRGEEDLETAYRREMKGVRECVGLVDVSSLGKIAVQGPDSAEFLNRVYVNGFGKLPVGKARYGVMLRDDGIVKDDGTTWRLAETDYFMTTTTANAASVMAWLEELLEIRWPDLRVRVTSVTEQWSGFAVAGPKARELLAGLVEDLDLSDAGCPFMAVREGHLDGAPCRIARISFSGELAYEVYVPSGYGEALAERLWAAAEPVGAVLYGTEALGALRIEKGHAAGAELDGRTTLDDLGLGRMASSRKPFVGNVLRKRPDLLKPERPRLVGVVPVESDRGLHNGALLFADEAVSGHGVGWITSVTYSHDVGGHIGLGFIAGGLEAWTDRTAILADPVRGLRFAVRIVPPCFVDPDGERLHA